MNIFCAVDDVVVAVAHRGGPQRRQIASCDGFGVADRELDGAVEDRGQELLLLLVGAALHERGPDGVEGDQRDGRVHPLRLFEEDELLERGKAASAILFGPADAEQVGGAERAHALLDRLAALHAAGDRGDALRRHHRLQRRPDLRAQLFLLGCEVQIHRSLPVPSRTGIRLTPGTIVARIRSTSPTSSSFGYRPSSTSKKTRASSRAS